MARTTILLVLTCLHVFTYSKTFDVDVGEDGFVFKPSSLTASPGDEVEFTFYLGLHSVARSDFQKPCQPSSADQIWSGFIQDTKTHFTIHINDTNPIWLYCAQVGHCAAGMSMVINPPSSGQTLASYQSSAKSASAATHPNEVQGGALSTSDGASRTTTMASGVTTSPSAASSHSPTSTGSGSSGPYGSSGSAKSAEVVASVGLFSFVMAATFYVVVLA